MKNSSTTSRNKARYKVVFRKSVAKDLRGIPGPDVRRILRAINALAEVPRPAGSEKLSGKERYRLRQGDYRILYEILEAEVIVVVVKVGHRREVYRHE